MMTQDPVRITDIKTLTLLAGQPERVEELLSRALESLAATVPCDLAGVLELRQGELVVRCVGGPLAGADFRAQRAGLDDVPIVRQALETRSLRVLREADTAHGSQAILNVPPGREYMIVPLVVGDRAIGALWLDRQESESDDQEQIDLATVYAQLIGLALTVAEQAANRAQRRTSYERATPGEWQTLNEVQSEHIRRVLDRTRGKIYGPGGAAEILDIKPSTLQSRMQKLGVERIASNQRRPTS